MKILSCNPVGTIGVKPSVLLDLIGKPLAVGGARRSNCTRTCADAFPG